MRKLKKILLWLLGVVLLLLLLVHLLLQYRARQVLKEVVENLSDDQYSAYAKKVDFDYFPVSVRLENLALQPLRTDKKLVRFQADDIQLTLGSFWALLLHNKLDVQAMYLHKANLVAYSNYHADSTGIRKPVAQTLAAVQEKFFQVFEAMDVRDAHLTDAAFKIINAQDTSRYFSLNHLNLTLEGFDLSKNGTAKTAPTFTSGNITLLRPDIHLEDSSLQIQLGKLVADGIKGDVEIDSLDINYQTLNDAREKVRLNSIVIRNFNWLRYLTEGFFEVDSVLIDKGEATLDLSNNNDAQRKQRTAYAGSSFLIHHAAISNVTYALTTNNYVDKNDVSMMRLQGDQLLVDELSIIKGRKPVLDVRTLNVHVRNYAETDSNSLYSTSLSDLAVQGHTLILRNYQLKERQKANAPANTVVVPQLRLDGYSLSDLLLRKLIAQKLTVIQPKLNLHVLGKQPQQQPANINQQVDAMLRKIEASIQLDDILVHEAVVKLIPKQTPNQEFTLLGLSLRIDGKQAVKANNVKELLQSINAFQTQGFTLTGKNILLKVTDAKLLSNPRGFYFGSVTGQFGEMANIDLRGVQILNANNSIDLTTQEGLSPSHVSVEGGSITFSLDKVSDTSKTIIPPISIGQLDLNDIQLNVQQHNQTTANASIQLHGSSLLFDKGMASWDSLRINSSGNCWQQGSTSLSAGSIAWFQPGVLQVHHAKGNTQFNNGKLEFNIPTLTAALNISNTSIDACRIANLQLEQPFFRIQTVAKKSIANQLSSSSGGIATPFFVQQLQMHDPHIEWLHQQPNGDTIAYSNVRKGLLNMKDVRIDGNTATNFSINSIRYSGDQPYVWLAKQAWQPAQVQATLSKLKYNATNQQLTFHVDSLQAMDLSYTITGNAKDTTNIQFGNMGIANYAFDASDSIQWKQLLLQQHWWISNTQVQYHNPKQVMRLHGLQAAQQHGLRWALDSMQWRHRQKREDFWQQEPLEKDHLQISTGRIQAERVRLDLQQQKPPIRIGRLLIDAINVWPQRDKTRPVDTVLYRPLLAQQIQQIPWPLQLDTILLRNGKVQYNEINQRTGLEGMVQFTQVHGMLTNVKTHNLHPQDSLILLVKASFYNKAPIWVNLRQSYADSLRSFWMRLRMGQMHMQEMNALLRSQLGLLISNGTVDTLTLLINGNDRFAYGTIDMRYRKMKVRLLNKTGEEHYFMSGAINWLANRVIRRHDNGKPNLVYKKRNVSKAQINFLSKIGLEAMLINVGIKTDRKERKKFKKTLEPQQLPANSINKDDL